jgi:predicted ATP-dependent protease
MVRELEARELRWMVPEEWLTVASSAELGVGPPIVGQDRAVEAIRFGLAMNGLGYNIFITGLSGTGRLTTVKRFLEEACTSDDQPDDICFVYNFVKPAKPRVVMLDAGAGRRLRDGMDEAVRELHESIPKVLSDRDFQARVERALAELKTAEKDLVSEFEGEVREAGFTLVEVQQGMMARPDLLPVVDGEPVPLEKLEAARVEGSVEPDQIEAYRTAYEQLSVRMREVFQKVAELRRQMQERVYEVRRHVLQPLLDEVVDRVRRTTADVRADEHLEAVRADLEENLDLFGSSSDDEADGDPFLRWRVNLAVDNADTDGRPVVLETEPSYVNLFGTVERTLKQSGEVVSDFTRIRAGSLLAANGGFLVLNADDVLMEPRVWPSLKRALKYRRARVQSIESLLMGAGLLQPEEVPLDVKVVVIGDRRIYDMLYRLDNDFAKIYKVLADFDSVMPIEERSVREFLSVLVKVISEEGLPPLDRSGLAAMLEVGVRQATGRRRLSSRFSDVCDVLREAAYMAHSDGAEAIARSHVSSAVEAQIRRHSLTEDRLHERLVEGVIHVATAGHELGQVNGLAVYDLGHHRFGKPSRITARIGLGRDGVVNIERQAGLSGPTHDKGVQILSGYLRGQFAQRTPLTMSCSITFEQSYGGIDGDSASSTEIYAILSALSGLPLRQDIAVTGSVDQYGRIQAIGGANEKIEGFYRLCAERGLTGSQGVMVPSANVGDLQLRSEVVEAVVRGEFHIWEVDTIAEGVELLTGQPAGEMDSEGGFPEATVFARCLARLEEMARQMREAGKSPAEDSDDSGDEEAVAEDGDDDGDDDPQGSETLG